MADQTTTADAINHAVDKISDGISKVAGAISAHAPQAWELVVRGAVASAIGNLIYGAAVLTASCSIAFISFKLMTRNVPSPTEYHTTGKVTAGDYFLIGCILAVIATAGVFFSIGYLADPHTIATLVSPQGTVARDMLNRAL